eukprot:3805633-Amphidinium_carterae.1
MLDPSSGTRLRNLLRRGKTTLSRGQTESLSETVKMAAREALVPEETQAHLPRDQDSKQGVVPMDPESTRFTDNQKERRKETKRASRTRIEISSATSRQAQPAKGRPPESTAEEHTKAQRQEEKPSETANLGKGKDAKKGKAAGNPEEGKRVSYVK